MQSNRSLRARAFLAALSILFLTPASAVAGTIVPDAITGTVYTDRKPVDVEGMDTLSRMTDGSGRYVVGSLGSTTTIDLPSLPLPTGYSYLYRNGDWVGGTFAGRPSRSL